MDLSIIIINYNTFQLTCNCIASIKEKLIDVDYEIVLVDNASVECDANLFAAKFPFINLVISPKNTGFTGGNNLGIQHAKGQYLLLLNSDTELINNAPKITLDYLKQHEPKVGMVGCQLIYPNGVIQPTTRKFRTIGWELLEATQLFRLLPKEKQGKLMLHHYFDHKSFANVDWIWGAYMLFKKDILEALPQKKLSDDFFMYCEDTLWCLDFKKLGYEIHYLPQAKVMHIHKGSVSKEKWLAIRKTGIVNHAQVMKKYYNGLLWYIWAAIYFPKQWLILAYVSLFNKYKQ
jgi:GT2 family glycosyltransferase